jgi:hypothetical protein
MLLSMLLFAGCFSQPGNPIEIDPASFCPELRSHGLDTTGLASVQRPQDGDLPGLMVLLRAEGFAMDPHSFVPQAPMEIPDRFVELILQAPGDEPEPRPQPVLAPLPADLGPLQKALEEKRDQSGLALGADTAGYAGQASLAVEREVDGARLVAALQMFWDAQHPELILVASSAQGSPPAWMDQAVAEVRLAGGAAIWPAGCQEATALMKRILETGHMAPSMLNQLQTQVIDALASCTPEESAHVLTNFQLDACDRQPVSRWTVLIDPEGQRVEVQPGAKWGELASSWLAYEDQSIWPVLVE